jgi:hypothetical protein
MMLHHAHTRREETDHPQQAANHSLAAAPKEKNTMHAAGEMRIWKKKRRICTENDPQGIKAR